jgi:5S rRNA maturation endonuclease (ribonuclease M5)
MQVSEDEILDIKKFILLLNSKKESTVVVEGKRDALALKKLGFTGKIVTFHRYGGLAKFADSLSECKNLILLLDGDRKGKYLTKRIIGQLQHRTRIDLSFKKKLVSITKGKIRFIEQLGGYESFFD